MNFGRLEVVGYDFRINYSPIQNIRERSTLTLHLTGGTNRATNQGFGRIMDLVNAGLFGHDEATIANRLQRWEDGRSPHDIWAVPSLGIDPASGREIFVNRYGERTFRFDSRDRVVVGNSRPLIEGTFGGTWVHRQLEVMLAFRYRLGAYSFNTALFERVENISRHSLGYNQDRRALHNRWHQPGDIAEFRRVDFHEPPTEMSSRFVQRRNQLTGESVNIRWRFERDGWIQQLGMQDLFASVSMRDIFYLSNVREERGLHFPFARSVTFNINATF
jgi:hypothetical protein